LAWERDRVGIRGWSAARAAAVCGSCWCPWHQGRRRRPGQPGHRRGQVAHRRAMLVALASVVVTPGRRLAPLPSAGRPLVYYIGAAEGGQPPGRWWGPRAQALGFRNGQEIERKPYDLLFGQRVHPLDGTRLGRRRLAADRATEAIYSHLLQAEPHATPATPSPGWPPIHTTLTRPG